MRCHPSGTKNEHQGFRKRSFSAPCFSFSLSDAAAEGISFDPVPFVPPPRSKIELAHYGHFILLGPDTTATKYIGFDTDYDLDPEINVPGDLPVHLPAHALAASDADFSYETRITGLYLSNTEFPVSTDGYAGGVFCVPEYAEFCAAASCRDNNTCAASSACVVDTDCASQEECVLGECVPTLSVDPSVCQADTDCDTGGKCLDGVCVNQCVEDSDCSPDEACMQGGCVPADSLLPSSAPITLDRAQIALAGTLLLALVI